MRDKVVLGVTLSVVLLLTLVIYGAVDTTRQPASSRTDLVRATVKGKHLYAQYCIQCHGPLGEGCIGPALNKEAWRPEINGTTNPDYDEGARDLIRRTLVRGRASNQPGIAMPAWSIEENGPLNDQEIDELTDFIQHGDWNTVLEDAASATNLQEELPTYAGFDDPERVAEVKEVMLQKGCLNCHVLGKGGGLVGADLTDVGSRRSPEWLRRWINDPKSVPAEERGPNLWLVGPTATVPAPEGVPANSTPAPTAQVFQMNQTYMPTIPLTDEELDLMVEYLSRARTTSR